MFRGLHAVCLCRHSGSYVVHIRHATMEDRVEQTAEPVKPLLNRAVLKLTGRGPHPASHRGCVAPDGPGSATDQRFRWSAWVWSPPPESNRRPHPYHVSPAHRHATLRFPRSLCTVSGAVMGWWPWDRLGRQAGAYRQASPATGTTIARLAYRTVRHSPSTRARSRGSPLLGAAVRRKVACRVPSRGSAVPRVRRGPLRAVPSAGWCGPRSRAVAKAGELSEATRLRPARSWLPTVAAG
jgi:hypothetical protein